MTVECLIGKMCSRVFEHYPQNYSFEFGEAVLAIDCLWRIVGNGRLMLTSSDHGQQFGLPAPIDAFAQAASLLCGKRVAAARLRSETADLTVEFEDGTCLEVISNSSGYEPWNLQAPGAYLVARGGGGFSDFSKPASRGTPKSNS